MNHALAGEHGQLKRRARRWQGAAVGLTAVTACALAGTVAPANASTGGGQASPVALTNVSAVSSNDVWSVGFSGSSNAYLPVSEHLVGGKWQIASMVEPPHVPEAQAEGVAAITANDVWALVDTGDGTAVIEHWAGKSWGIAKTPVVHAQTVDLLAISATSSNDVWVGGFTRTDTRRGSLFTTLTEHWNGNAWSIVSSPNPIGKGYEINLEGLYARTASDAWASGFYSNGTTPYVPFVMHWNGKAWSLAKVSAPSGSTGALLAAVTSVSASDAWAVGLELTSTAYVPLTEHWNGTTWSVVKTPGPKEPEAGLLSASAVTPDNVWSVGASSAGAVLEHWTGSHWTLEQNPKGLTGAYVQGLATVSANDAWAVGFQQNGSTTVALTLHWNGKAWTKA